MKFKYKNKIKVKNINLNCLHFFMYYIFNTNQILFVFFSFQRFINIVNLIILLQKLIIISSLLFKYFIKHSINGKQWVN